MSDTSSGGVTDQDSDVQRTAEQAKARASDVQDTARQEASRVTDEAKRQSQGLVQDAKTRLRDQGQDQTQRLAGVLHGVAGDARAVVEGRPDQAGEVGDYARQATDQLQRLADRVDELGFDGVIDEVGRFARRRPGAFLFGAAAAGFAVARVARGAKDEQATQSASDTGSDPGRIHDEATPGSVGQPPVPSPHAASDIPPDRNAT